MVDERVCIVSGDPGQGVLKHGHQVDANEPKRASPMAGLFECEALLFDGEATL